MFTELFQFVSGPLTLGELLMIEIAEACRHPLWIDGLSRLEMFPCYFHYRVRIGCKREHGRECLLSVLTAQCLPSLIQTAVEHCSRSISGRHVP